MKKKKIKVPAAKYGLTKMAGLPETVLLGSIANGTAPGVNGITPMAVKQPINLGKTANAVNTVFDAVPGLVNLFATKSTATTGGQAIALSVSDIANQAAAGYNIGKNFGPVGAAIGGATGAAVGLVGKKGESAEMTSFTDFDEGTLGTGLIGAFHNKKARKERARIRTNAYNNRAAVEGTINLLNQYGLDYGDLSTNTFARGGAIPSSLAYVDDGELIQTPDGQVSKVPEKGQPVDNNLVSLPEGSRVLSNTLKVPGTKKTFSQLGDEMMTKKKSKNTDRFAENANKLNEMNNKLIHDLLFAIQEGLKAKKGIKNKSKEVLAFEGGGLKTYGFDTRFKDFDTFYSPQYMEFVNSLKEGDLNSLNWLNRINRGEFGNIGGNTFNIADIKRLATDKKRGPVHNAMLTASLAYQDSKIRGIADNAVENLMSIYNPYTNTTASTIVKEKISPANATLTEVSSDGPTSTVSENDVANYTPTWYNILSNIGTDIATLAPVMSNMLSGRAEKVNAVYNPYESAINRTMRGRRFNINPAIEDVNRNRAISNYNMRQMNTNTGANLAYGLQGAVNTDRAIANLRAQESNANNAYAGEYANMMNSLGQQYVGATNLAADLNALNRATARNIRRTGLSQLSQYAQTKQQMRNQRTRDKAFLELYKPFLQAGYSDLPLQTALKEFYRG